MRALNYISSSVSDISNSVSDISNSGGFLQLRIYDQNAYLLLINYLYKYFSFTLDLQQKYTSFTYKPMLLQEGNWHISC